MTTSSLRRSADFRRVLSNGDRVRRGGITVIRDAGPEAQVRIGLVVGRSVGNAVARNRVKRRLRHALKDTQWEPGMDYVIIADRQVGEVPFTVLSDWVGRAAGRAR